MAATVSVRRPYSKGRGRGRRVHDALQIPGVSNNTPMQNSFRTVGKIIEQMIGLNEAEVTKIILPVVEGLTRPADIEELVNALGERALCDPEFATIAAQLASKIWDSKSMHSLIRNPLLKQMQTYYTQREKLQDENRYHGLCVYLCELFRRLRLGDKPLLPIADAVVDVLKGMIGKRDVLKGRMGKREEPSDEDVFYFSRELENVGSILAEFSPQKLENLINLTRETAVMCTLNPTARCRLTQLIELNAMKWNMNDGVKLVYANLQQDLKVKGK